MSPLASSASSRLAASVKLRLAARDPTRRVFQAIPHTRGGKWQSGSNRTQIGYGGINSAASRSACSHCLAIAGTSSRMSPTESSLQFPPSRTKPNADFARLLRDWDFHRHVGRDFRAASFRRSAFPWCSSGFRSAQFFGPCRWWKAAPFPVLRAVRIVSSSRSVACREARERRWRCPPSGNLQRPGILAASDGKRVRKRGFRVCVCLLLPCCARAIEPGNNAMIASVTAVGRASACLVCHAAQGKTRQAEANLLTFTLLFTISLRAIFPQFCREPGPGITSVHPAARARSAKSPHMG